MVVVNTPPPSKKKTTPLEILNKTQVARPKVRLLHSFITVPSFAEFAACRKVPTVSAMVTLSTRRSCVPTRVCDLLSEFKTDFQALKST